MDMDSETMNGGEINQLVPYENDVKVNNLSSSNLSNTPSASTSNISHTSLQHAINDHCDKDGPPAYQLSVKDGPPAYDSFANDVRPSSVNDETRVPGGFDNACFDKDVKDACPLSEGKEQIIINEVTGTQIFINEIRAEKAEIHFHSNEIRPKNTLTDIPTNEIGPEKTGTKQIENGSKPPNSGCPRICALITTLIVISFVVTVALVVTIPLQLLTDTNTVQQGANETKESGPLPPQNVSVTAVDTNTLRVSWIPQETRNNSQDRFEVYLTQNKSSKVICTEVLNSTSTECTFNVQGIPGSSYTVYVASIAGTTESDLVKATGNTKPAAVTDIDYLKVTGDTIEITWIMAPTVHDSVTITLNDVTDSTMNTRVVSDVTAESYTFTSLQAGHRYRISVEVVSHGETSDVLNKIFLTGTTVPAIPDGLHYLRTHEDLGGQHFAMWTTQDPNVIAMGGWDNCNLTLVTVDGVMTTEKLEDCERVQNGVNVQGTAHAVIVEQKSNFTLSILDINPVNNAINITRKLDVAYPRRLLDIDIQTFAVASFADDSDDLFIHVYNRSDYTLVKTVYIIQKSGFSSLDSIALTPNGEWLVCISYESKIYRYKSDGTFIERIGTKSDAGELHNPGYLFWPVAVYVDSDGGVLAAGWNGDLHRYKYDTWTIVDNVGNRLENILFQQPHVYTTYAYSGGLFETSIII